jgi:hypothetical protein
MRKLAIAASLAAAVQLGGCAGTRGPATPPPGSLTVATVRHTAGPQPAAVWLAADALPPDAQRSDGGRALLLEVALRDGAVATVETAPLELANLVVRIESRDRRQTVVAIENRNDVALGYSLYVSPDGERFRRVPSCPVAAGGIAYERWPEAAAWIAVGAWQVADSAAPCG